MSSDEIQKRTFVLPKDRMTDPSVTFSGVESLPKHIFEKFAGKGCSETIMRKLKHTERFNKN